MNCIICGKYTPTKRGGGGLCYKHGKAFYDYYEEMKGVLENEKQEGDT